MNIHRISLGILLTLLSAFPSFGGELFYATGSYVTSHTDLNVAARSVPMAWERTYRSNRMVKQQDELVFDFRLPVEGPLGYGWHTPWTVRIENDNYVGPDGRHYPFAKDNAGNYLPDRSNGWVLTKTPGGFELQEVGGNTQVFDPGGKLTAIRDPRGRSAILSYAGDSLVSISDVSGRTIFTFTYSGTHISRVTDIAGRSIDYGYDGNGNLATVSSNGQVIASYSYNGVHGLIRESNAIGEVWSVGYLYPDKGVANRITNPAGKTLAARYDFENRIFNITNYNGVSKKMLLDQNGKLVGESEISAGNETVRQTVAYLPDGVKKTTDGAGNTTAEKQNEWESPLQQTDAEGNTTSFTYNSQNKPLTVTDANGVVTAFQYDGSGVYPTKITRAQGQPEQVITSFSYNSDGDLESTSTDGATTSFTYNPAGLPLTITDPVGNKSILEYDLVGNVTGTVDASGNRSGFTYDWRGNLLTARDPLGNVTTYNYSMAGRLLAVKDPLGRETKTTTDFAGRITSLVPPAGAAKMFTYDGGGNLVKVVEGDALTTFTYDGRNRLTSETDPEGNVTSREYEPTGCPSCGGSETSIPKKIIDPLGNATISSFDKVGRVTAIQDPLGYLTSMVYDKVGRVTSRTDGNGNATAYGYGGLGRIVSQTDANGGVTSFTYDKRGNLTSLTDPEGNTTSFEYDLAGRKTKETRPMGQATLYDYYANGLLKTVKDAKGQTTVYSYDKGNRLIEIVFADGRKNSFGYDAAGNMTSYASPDVSATITYDGANRKTSETVTMGGFTKTYSYSYDAKGNKAGFTSPEGATYGYTYNKNSQPTRITTPAGAIELAYQWNRQTQVKLPNGITTDYGYNDNSWLTSINAGNTKLTPPAPFTNAGYTFDKVGNITGKSTENGSHSYGYDRIYQLTSATIPTLPQEAYSYDRVGNRKTSAQTEGSWSYNANNELLSYNGTTFGYDPNGNTVTKTEGTGSGTVPVPLTTPLTTTYIYGATDRLERVELPDGKIATYAYDPFGRRVRKQVGAEVTFYLYADEGLIGEYDATGSFKKGYGWRPDGIWGTNPLFMVEGGSYYFYHNDHLGAPQKMTDQTGNVVWSATYTAFGEVKVDAASTVVSNLRFPGQYWDGETGLHYNWNRYYDVRLGKYTQPDPTGLSEGADLYYYAGNCPTRYIDITGLSKVVLYSSPFASQAAAQVNVWASTSTEKTIAIQVSNINDVIEAMQNVNSLSPKGVSELVFMAHGNSDYIYLDDNEYLSANGEYETPMGNIAFPISGLPVIKFKKNAKIWLNSCHGGSNSRHGNNVAQAFKNRFGADTYAFDYSIKYKSEDSSIVIPSNNSKFLTPPSTGDIYRRYMPRKY